MINPFFDYFTEPEGDGYEVVLWADTFNTWFEPENIRAARRVLEAGGYKVYSARTSNGGRPLCCGRTFLAAGLIEDARTEAQRTLDGLWSFVSRGVPIVGLEPSCLFTLRDEFLAMNLGPEAKKLADQAFMFEEFLVREKKAGRFRLNLKPIEEKRALLHGHCHQRAFSVMGSVKEVLSMVPNLNITVAEGSCCGMAGAFGYDAKNFNTSIAMAEEDLLPRVRSIDEKTIVVADGISCRHQISDGSGREAIHMARVLENALDLENVVS